MDETIDLMLELMENTFRDFEGGMVNTPVLVELSYGPAYRFREKNIHQAMIQKLARVLSSVRAARLLLTNGFLQEQAILHRIIDETNDDIMFLVYAVTNDRITELHEKFLDAFWEEEIDDSGNILDSEQKRPMIPRQKIHAYLARIEGVASDPSTQQKLISTLTKAYSGFVHGASPHIMEMYDGEPPYFHTNGMLGTMRVEGHANDYKNYVYRSFISFIAVGKALGADAQVTSLTKQLRSLEPSLGIHN